jgi:hypothetical protein
MICTLINKNTLKYLIALLSVMVMVSSCEYETIEVETPDLDEPVSFVSDIVPIFTNGNNCTACHGTGGTSPELTAEKAYSSIVPRLVDLDDPESSRIYQLPLPSTTGHGFKKYTHGQAALVLAWITQGAENN